MTEKEAKKVATSYRKILDKYKGDSAKVISYFDSSWTVQIVKFPWHSSSQPDVFYISEYADRDRYIKDGTWCY